MAMAESQGKGQVRRRLDTVGSKSNNKDKDGTTKSSSEGDDAKLCDGLKPKRMENEKVYQCQMQAGTYWLTRIVFTRSIGFIYCKLYSRSYQGLIVCLFPPVVAFLVALHQNKELLGSNGLLPIPLYFSRLKNYFEVETNTTKKLCCTF